MVSNHRPSRETSQAFPKSQHIDAAELTLILANNPIMDPAPITTKTYIVEHLDPELGPWSALEYASIAAESASAGAHFCLSSVSKELNIPDALCSTTGFTFDDRSVEILCKDNQSRVCLLDPAAAAPLCPEDGDLFDVFLFGGILGNRSFLRSKGS